MSAVDDVTDWIEDAADALILYEVTEPISEVRTLARLLTEMTEQIVEAMPLLREKKNLPRIKAYTVEINRLENEARPSCAAHSLAWCASGATGSSSCTGKRSSKRSRRPPTR